MAFFYGNNTDLANGLHIRIIRYSSPGQVDHFGFRVYNGNDIVRPNPRDFRTFLGASRQASKEAKLWGDCPVLFYTVEE
jgi:hypothetical protein